MNYYSFPQLIISLLLLLLGIFVVQRNKDTRLTRPFLLMCLSSSSWLFFYFLAYSTHSEPAALLWFKIGYCGVVLIPVTTLHFTQEFLDSRKLQPIVYASYCFALLCIAAIWNSAIIIKGTERFFWGHYPIAGPMHPVFLAFFFGLVSFILILYLHRYTQTILMPLKKAQIKYIFLALSVFSFASADFLPNYGKTLYPFGYLPAFLFLLIIGYTIAKYRLMDIKVAFTRAGIFLTLYTAVLGIPFYIGYNTDSWLLSTSFAVILATTGPLIYRKLQHKAENYILSEQRRYQKILMEAARGMAREHHLDRLLKLIVHIVKKTVRIKYAAIFIDEPEHKGFRLKAIRDVEPVPIDLDVIFAYDHPLVKFIKELREPFTIEEVSEEFREYFAFRKGTSLVVPSMVEDKLLGILVLGEKLNKAPYSQDDINVFKILSHQAALATENCRFMEEFQKTQERIFAAEKLASVGGMAEGVAHQIKNRLNQFSVASGELKLEVEDLMENNKELLAQNPDLDKSFQYFKHIADSMVTNVKRTDGIIKGILNYAREGAKETYYSHFSLREVIDLSLELLKVKHELQLFPLELELDANDTIYGVKSQIIESVYNVLDNGYESTKDHFTFLDELARKSYLPVLKLKLTQGLDFSQIEVSDNGIGIREEHKHKIFAPFFTTKSSYKSGTGIGMYVVKRMVEENHKGKIWFTSEYGSGTRIFIKLPRSRSEHRDAGVLPAYQPDTGVYPPNPA